MKNVRVTESKAEASLVIEVSCAGCQRSPRRDVAGDAFLEMAPGHDGVPWYLCAACWFDGIFPNNPKGLLSSTARIVETDGCPTP